MTAETDAAAAAGALRAAAKIVDRMNRIARTPYAELTERQRQEFEKYCNYHPATSRDLISDGFDTARWLRDLADRTARITANREYGVAIRHYNGHWILPSGKGIGTHDDAHEAFEAIFSSGRATAAGVTEAKVVSRTKAGPWEDEEA